MKNRLFGAFALVFVMTTVALAQTVAAPATPVDWWALIQTYIMTPASISGVVGLLMAILPQGAPGTVWGIVRMVLDLVAMNFGNAQNAPKV